MDKLGVVLWVLAMVLFGLAAFMNVPPPDEARRLKLVACGLLCIAVAQVFGLGATAFKF